MTSLPISVSVLWRQFSTSCLISSLLRKDILFVYDPTFTITAVAKNCLGHWKEDTLRISTDETCKKTKYEIEEPALIFKKRERTLNASKMRVLRLLHLRTEWHLPSPTFWTNNRKTHMNIYFPSSLLKENGKGYIENLMAADPKMWRILPGRSHNFRIYV